MRWLSKSGRWSSSGLGPLEFSTHGVAESNRPANLTLQNETIETPEVKINWRCLDRAEASLGGVASQGVWAHDRSRFRRRALGHAHRQAMQGAEAIDVALHIIARRGEGVGDTLIGDDDRSSFGDERAHRA